MKRFAQEEAEKGSELVVFPELSNSCYFTPVVIGQLPSYDSKTSAAEFAVNYVKASEPVPGPTTEILGEVTRKYGVYIVVGISQLHPVITGTLYNSAVLIGPSGVIGIHHKMHIPLNERYYFYPGNTADVYRTGWLIVIKLLSSASSAAALVPLARAALAEDVLKLLPKTVA